MNYPYATIARAVDCERTKQRFVEKARRIVVGNPEHILKSVQKVG